MNNKISIIVPVYNVEKYLEQCVESLLNQTYSNIEIILVDDGSTDSSSAMCDLFATADSRVKVVHQKNSRIGAARNRGIEEATGDYLTFIDSDDFIESNTYEVCMELMKQYDVDLVQWDLNFINEIKGKSIIQNREESEYTELILDRDGGLQKLFEWKNMDVRFNHLWTDTHCVWTKICKKELFDDVRFPINKEYEDEMILHKILFKCNKVVFVNRRFSNYRLRAESTVHTMPLKGKMDKIDAFLDRYEMMKEIGNVLLISGSVHDLLVAIFNTYLQASDEKNNDAKAKLIKFVRKIGEESEKYMDKKDKAMANMLRYCPYIFTVIYGCYRKKK